jgi:hypothetical protein
VPLRVEVFACCLPPFPRATPYTAAQFQLVDVSDRNTSPSSSEVNNSYGALPPWLGGYLNTAACLPSFDLVAEGRYLTEA